MHLELQLAPQQLQSRHHVAQEQVPLLVGVLRAAVQGVSREIRIRAAGGRKAPTLDIPARRRAVSRAQTGRTEGSAARPAGHRRTAWAAHREGRRHQEAHHALQLLEVRHDDLMPAQDPPVKLCIALALLDAGERREKLLPILSVRARRRVPYGFPDRLAGLDDHVPARCDSRRRLPAGGHSARVPVRTLGGSRGARRCSSSGV